MRNAIVTLIAVVNMASLAAAADRPNILIAISDDQSWPHASAYGSKMVNTPAFDRVAREGVLFTNAYGASPGCSPCRAALLTGRHTWQIEHAGTHASSFPAKYETYPEILGANGYFVGYTGKGWGPGNFRADGRTENPAGPSFSKHKTEPPHSGMSKVDYAANFADFLQQKPADQPFCFWYGAQEPHRGFEQGSGLEAGKTLAQAEVPSFLPDVPAVRSDLLDYAVEIEWFDEHLGRILKHLEDAGELDNTLIIVTSDNGMAFPRAKANCYEYGIHMPLAIRWGNHVPKGRTSADLIGFVDLTATIFDATGVEHPSDEYPLAGQSIMNILRSDKEGIVDPSRTAVFSARERHSSSRYQNLSYPQRAMRTHQYLYVWNARPERWPAGAPQKFEADGELGNMHGGYHDIDSCPTLTYLIEERDDARLGKYLFLAVDHRPEIEIFDIVEDPGCLVNLAGRPEFAATERQLAKQFEQYLVATGDPRILNGGDIFETYPRYSALRSFPMPEHVQQRWEKMRSAGWIPLFDGRSLDGWTASPPQDSFQVVNGMIKAQATRNESHLFYTGDVHDGDFEDFELLFEVMTTPGSNSGVYFHTSYQEQGFPNDGHEVQVNNTHKNKTRTGSLFAVQDVSETIAEDNAFYTEHVEVQGRHVTVRVSPEPLADYLAALEASRKGETPAEPARTTVDYEEPADYQHPTYTERNIDHGTFALQAHDPESVAYFREIWVRPLP